MKFLTISKIVLSIVLPIALFLLVLDFAVFDESFYKKEFSDYEVQKNVPNAVLLHESVINFINGKNINLPSEFNNREKQHLLDVRKTANIFKIALYTGIILFLSLSFFPLKILKPKRNKMKFIGDVFLLGGSLAILLAGILFFLLNSNFAGTFESFHRLFFEAGTYVFDPSKEIIVRIYPEQLFMDLGIRISELFVLASLILVFFGILLKYMPKNKKVK